MRKLLSCRPRRLVEEDRHDALKRGVGFLRSSLTPAGHGAEEFFRSKVRSRILETALTLHLLQREGLEPEWQSRLRAYLMGHRAGADGLESVLANQVLGREPGSRVLSALDRLVEDLEYTRSRKRRLLLLFFMETGLVPFDAASLTPDPGDGQPHHLFGRIYAAAIRLFVAKRRGLQPGTLPESTFLRETQGESGGWEQQLLLTLAVLLSIGRDMPDVFERGLRFLARHEREDGGLPFCDNLNRWTSALAGLALCEAAPVTRPALGSVGHYLVSRQDSRGGWVFTEEVLQTDVDTSTQCAQFLLQLDARRYQDSIARAQRYLLGMQREDGGYPTYVREDSSEVTMTANAVLVQARGLPHDFSLRKPLERGLRFLVSRQHPDGSFERSWSLCETYSLFRVMWALEACEEAGLGQGLEATRASALRYLYAHQREDGSWGQTPGEPGDVLSTAYALAALAILRSPERMSPAVDYLLSQQDERGAFPCRPDVVGPRPLVLDDPLLGTIFTVMALGMALHPRPAPGSSGAAS